MRRVWWCFRLRDLRHALLRGVIVMAHPLSVSRSGSAGLNTSSSVPMNSSAWLAASSTALLTLSNSRGVPGFLLRCSSLVIASLPGHLAIACVVSPQFDCDGVFALHFSSPPRVVLRRCAADTAADVSLLGVDSDDSHLDAIAQAPLLVGVLSVQGRVADSDPVVAFERAHVTEPAPGGALRPACARFSAERSRGPPRRRAAGRDASAPGP